MATTNAQKTTLSVPTTMGSTPKEGLANCGVHFVPNRNSVTDTCWKNSIVPNSSESTFAGVTTTESAAQRTRKALMVRSPYRGLEASSDRCGDTAPALEAVTTDLVMVTESGFRQLVRLATFASASCFWASLSGMAAAPAAIASFSSMTNSMNASTCGLARPASDGYMNSPRDRGV